MKNKKELIIPLLAAFIIGVLLGYYIIPNPQATAGTLSNRNGPFVIVQGIGPNLVIDGVLQPYQICGSQYSRPWCCNWAQQMAIECNKGGWENCRTVDMIPDQYQCNFDINTRTRR